MTRRIANLVGLLSLIGLGLLAGDELVAQQVPYSTACRTNVGICATNPSPVSAACRCFNDSGRIVLPPPNWGTVCRTPQAACRVWPLPQGSRCACGNQAGQIHLQ